MDSSNLDEAIDVLRHFSQRNDSKLDFVYKRLLGEITATLTFKKNGQYSEAKHAAQAVKRNITEAREAFRENATVSDALTILEQTVEEVLSLPDTVKVRGVSPGVARQATQGLELYPTGSIVQIAALDALKEFAESWRFHHPLSEAQLAYAGLISRVSKVEYYHGGDVLYYLEGTNGWPWHEQLLSPRQETHSPRPETGSSF